ncbi:hypothetical protein [Saccharothrix violaceirubra]|uniref:Uncharacterized protein n=1 Tax=Saccharothrix violaceirubra TaxID=413306 RepID=A0A7W7T1H5_9PSEU|nr:hypothetical protein [Saccharothrix violaceirubra]MBB4964828.1 hypothetical protein [Saccharothrix violaceirubra]
MGNPSTPREFAERIVSLGLAAPEAAAEFADWELDEEDDPLRTYHEILIELGLAVQVPVGDTDDLERTYADVLSEVVGLTGGAVEVADVRLADDLRSIAFTIDGVRKEWHTEHHSTRHLDQLAIYEFVSLFDPPDGRRFRGLGLADDYDDPVYLLATEEHARVLADEFGVTS